MSVACRSLRNVILLGGLICFGLCLLPQRVAAQNAQAAADAPAAVTIVAADGKLKFQVPGTWTAKQPTVRIIEHEFSAPAPEGEDTSGRLTMMAAGGSVEANIERWKGQFQAGDSELKAKLEKLNVNGQNVDWVDLTGTYLDRRGPFGPATPRADYRMLGAIIEVPGGGLYFLKFYGPKATLDVHDEAFLAMVKGMELP